MGIGKMYYRAAPQKYQKIYNATSFSSRSARALDYVKTLPTMTAYCQGIPTRRIDFYEIQYVDTSPSIAWMRTKTRTPLRPRQERRSLLSQRRLGARPKSREAKAKTVKAKTDHAVRALRPDHQKVKEKTKERVRAKGSREAAVQAVGSEEKRVRLRRHRRRCAGSSSKEDAQRAKIASSPTT